MVVVIVVAAGLFIVGAPAPVLTYVRKERRPARRWLSDAVLRFSAARGAPLRGVQASGGVCQAPADRARGGLGG